VDPGEFLDLPPQLVPPGLDATHILEPPDEHRAASVP